MIDKTIPLIHLKVGFVRSLAIYSSYMLSSCNPKFYIKIMHTRSFVNIPHGKGSKRKSSSPTIYSCWPDSSEMASRNIGQEDPQGEKAVQKTQILDGRIGHASSCNDLRCLAQTSAIWPRQELPVHRNRNLGRFFIVLFQYSFPHGHGVRRLCGTAGRRKSLDRFEGFPPAGGRPLHVADLWQTTR